MNIKEAYAKATPGPLIVVKMRKVHGTRDIECEIQGGLTTLVASTPTEANNPAGYKLRNINAALLAHAYNVLPEVLEKLDDLVCAADELTDGQIDPKAGQAERDFIAAHEAARKLIAKASEVKV